MDEKVSVFIVGPCGTGKSHIAQALGHCAIRLGHDVMFTTQSKMLAKLHAARATNTYERQFNQLTKASLLIIDDFGLKPLRPPQDEDLHDVISERYERRSTIVTSNLDLAEWGDAFPNRLLGAATIDRLRHGAYKVVLDGKSYRCPRNTEKSKKTTAEKQPKNALAKGGDKS
jgi:DNA replication protein DnaC